MKIRPLYRLPYILLLTIVILSACGKKPAPTDTQEQNEPVASSETTQTRQLATDEPVQGEDISGRLLFVQEGTIWLWQGGEARPFIGAGESWQPEWSQDGERIAYIERGASYSNVMIADEQGDFMAQLTLNDSDLPLQSHERIYDTMWAFYPTWSPGGQRVTVVTQYAPPVGSPALEYTLSIYSLSARGGARRQIYADDTAHCGSMVYLPNSSDDEDGKNEMDYVLVFTRIDIRPDGVQQLYRLDIAAEDGYARPFPGAPPGSYDPAFSQDGEWLAFAARVEEETDIWVLPGTPDDEDAPEPQQLTTMGTARAPAFSPDGSKLAFLAIPPGESGFALWMMDIEQRDDQTIQAGEPRQMTLGMTLDADSGLSWAE
jgi:TolB protein